MEKCHKYDLKTCIIPCTLFLFFEKQYTMHTLIKIYSKNKLINKIDSKDKYKPRTEFGKTN